MNAPMAVRPGQGKLTRVTFAVYDWPGNVCGPASWIQRLLPALAEYGIQSSCLALCWEAPGPLVWELQKLGIPVSKTICRGTAEGRIRWVLQQVQQHTPDVFVPNLCVPALYAARWVRHSGVPTLGVLHSDDGFYSGIQDVFCCGRDVDALTAIVSVSRELHQRTVALGLPRTESIWIPYGVSLPPQRPLSSADFRIGYVGRLSEEQKRISKVVNALCNCVKNIDRTTAHIFGDGPDRDAVREILATTGSGLPVELVGRVEPAEIQHHLLQLDALLLLSDYEGLPIALMEAMACGVVPVVSNMKSGIPELVRHMETGWVVNDRNESVVQAIRTLKDDISLRTRLSGNARELIRERFSHEASVAAWADCLLRLAKDSRPVPLSMPGSMNLPQVHAALAAEDPRELKEPLHSLVIGRIRKTLKTILSQR